MASAPGQGLDRRPLGALAAPALVAVVVAAGLGGAVTAYVVGDPGPVIRWSLPILRTLRDLLAAATIGLLLVAAFLTPETTRTHRREHATVLARRAGVAWVAVLLLGVVAEFSDLSGLVPTEVTFWASFLGLGWELPATRLMLISAMLVGVVVVLATHVTSTLGRAWAMVTAWGALFPLALAGHSAVSRDHMSSINSLAIHIVAATTWVGGLLALVLLRRTLGSHLAITVARFSTVAAWAYAALVLSGLLAAWLNLTSPRDLLSAYGAMLATKAVALVLLGAAGWWHRRHVIDVLRTRPGDVASFVRLGIGELALMGVAMGTAAALARTPPPASGRLSPDPTSVYELTGYADPGPPPADVWLSTWHIDWLWVAVAAVAVGLYVRWAISLWRRGDRWPVGRVGCWVLGWAVFVYATSGAPGVYGRVMFSWHMVSHMAIAMLVPLLLVPAAPLTLALRALPTRHDKTMGPRELVLALVHSRALQIIANPVIAAANFFFSLAAFYFTPLFGLALSTHTGHILMTVHFLASGYLFAWVLVGSDPGPKRWPAPILLIVLFATISFHAFLGVVITGSQNLLAPDFFLRLGLGWLPDPISDQQRGGAIAWGVGEAPTLVLAMLVAIQWVRADRRDSVRLDRQADRDDDAALAAYNADLARRAAAGGRDRTKGADR